MIGAYILSSNTRTLEDIIVRALENMPSNSSVPGTLYRAYMLSSNHRTFEDIIVTKQNNNWFDYGEENKKFWQH